MRSLRQANAQMFSSRIGLMHKEGLLSQQAIPLDSQVCAYLLQTCLDIKSLEQIHGQMLVGRLDQNIYLGTKLVGKYAECRRMDNARVLFDRISKRDVLLWNVMIRGYASHGPCGEALKLYYQMQRAGIEPDNFTFPFVLKACAGLSALEEGKQIYDHIIRTVFESDVIVGNALVGMYAKCGSIMFARQLFDKMPERDVASWNTMIVGYAQKGYANKALTLFNQMLLANVKPNRITIVSVLPACADLAALGQGKGVHDHVIKNGFEVHVSVQNSLIDIYAKCGRIDIAHQLFDRMSERSVVSWSAMIAGYGMHGQGEDALTLFFKMLQTGVKPDYITFICVLSACSHAGLVDKGWHCFDCMVQDYCITPRQQHYACMVDLLGRAGHLDEARDFIEKMPLELGATVWGALLSACRIYYNADLGEHVAERLFDVDPENAGHYIQLSNIYAAAGRWDDVAKVRAMMKDRGLKKTAGCSLIEINNSIHAFLMGDKSHPQSEKIYAMLETLGEQMKKAGYVPDMNFVLHDMEEDVKVHEFCSHSEKLDIAFGLMNTNFSNPYSDHRSSTYVW